MQDVPIRKYTYRLCKLFEHKANSCPNSRLVRRLKSDPIDFAPLRNRFYFDEIYAFLIRATQGVLASISAFIDRWILDVGFVRGASGATWGFGSLLRLLQVGNLQAYSFLFGLGIVGLIYFTIFR